MTLFVLLNQDVPWCKEKVLSTPARPSESMSILPGLISEYTLVADDHSRTSFDVVIEKFAIDEIFQLHMNFGVLHI